MERLESEEQRDRAARHLRTDPGTLGPCVARKFQHAAPAVGVVVVLGEGEAHRTADGGRQAPHPVHLPIGGGEVLAQCAGRGEFENPRARVGQRLTDSEEFVLGREGARHGFAVDRHVSDGP